MVRQLQKPERVYSGQRRPKQRAKDKLGRGKPRPARRLPSESPFQYEAEWPRKSPTLVLLFAGIGVIIGMFAFTTFHWADEWGPFGLMEGLFACTVVPVYFINQHYGTLEKSMGTAKTGPRALVLFLLMVVIQLVTQINLTITTYERALYYCMAPFGEEFFFRALVCRGIAGNQNNTTRAVLAVIISTVLFAAAHVGYYGNWRAMVFIVGFGIASGALYLYWKDLNAVVIAHFLLNFIVSFQILYQVLF